MYRGLEVVNDSGWGRQRDFGIREWCGHSKFDLQRSHTPIVCEGLELASVERRCSWSAESLFDQVILGGADLRGAVLTNAQLIGACLDDADLNWADASTALFLSADLPRADLAGSVLRRFGAGKLGSRRISKKTRSLIRTMGAKKRGKRLPRAIGRPPTHRWWQFAPDWTRISGPRIRRG